MMDKYDRFFSKVIKTDTCWIWTATKNNHGYGMFRPGGIAEKKLAHRVCYQILVGEIPKGKILLHSCDNPACVNPDHLKIGTMKDNSQDMAKKGRSTIQPIIKNNEAHIIEKYKTQSAESIAREYNVSAGAITSCLRRNGIEIANKQIIKFTDNEINSIISSRNNGEGLRTIAKRFSVDRSVIKRIIRDH